MSETLDLQKTYTKEIKPELSKKFGDLNVHAVPRIDKIVLNSGIGKVVALRKAKSSGSTTDEEMFEDIINGLAVIGGQRPQLVRARRSISGFKLREGTLVGVMATLRGRHMYDFLARLIHVALPRTRDFRGLSEKSVDQGGNLTIGIRDSSIFPELPHSNFSWGFEVTLVTNTSDREQAIELFKSLGIPLK